MPGGTTSVRRPAALALQLAEGVEASRLPGHRRALFLSIAGGALLAASDQKNAERFLQRAAEEYDKVGRVPSVLMSEFINARARLGDPTARDDLQKLVSAWQKVNPNSIWHGRSVVLAVASAGGQRPGRACGADQTTGRADPEALETPGVASARVLIRNEAASEWA